MSNGTLGERFSQYLGRIEIVIYSILAVLLSLTILVTIARAGKMRRSTPAAKELAEL